MRCFKLFVNFSRSRLVEVVKKFSAFLSLDAKTAGKLFEVMTNILVSLILLTIFVNEGLSQKENLVSYLQFEKTFISDLEDYIERQESVLQLLRKKLLNFKVEHSDALENPEMYFSNELNKFLLVKRLASDVELLSNKTFDVANRFQSKVNSYQQRNLLPSKDDLMTSAMSIARLQKAQNLKADKLAKGIFGDIKRR